MKTKYYIKVFLFCSLTSFAQKSIELTTNFKCSFRAIELSSNNVLFASGSNGTVIKSLDNGVSWQDISPKLYSEYDFRGLQVLNNTDLLVLSSGEAEKGKAIILKSSNQGDTWEKVFETNQPGVFLDGITFINNNHGFVLGDPIENKAFLLETKDAGNTWKRLLSNLPDLKSGEASFAASNSSLGSNKSKVWFITQNRFFVSENKGKSWSVFETGFESTSTSGLFGSFFINSKIGFCVGGDYKVPLNSYPNFIKTVDGGKTWSKPLRIDNVGLKESVWFNSKGIGFVTGPSGTSFSRDFGKNWTAIDNQNLHAMVGNSNYFWAIGAKGNLWRYEYK